MLINLSPEKPHRSAFRPFRMKQKLFIIISLFQSSKRFNERRNCLNTSTSSIKFSVYCFHSWIETQIYQTSVEDIANLTRGILDSGQAAIFWSYVVYMRALHIHGLRTTNDWRGHFSRVKWNMNAAALILTSLRSRWFFPIMWIFDWIARAI